MEGHQGQVVIGLPVEILPTCVTVHHVFHGSPLPHSASSAPRDVAVLVSLCLGSGHGTMPERGLASFWASAETCVPVSPEHCSAPGGYAKSWRGGIPLEPCFAKRLGALDQTSRWRPSSTRSSAGLLPEPRGSGAGQPRAQTARTFALCGTSLSGTLCALLARDWMWMEARRFPLGHSPLTCGRSPCRPSC